MLKKVNIVTYLIIFHTFFCYANKELLYSGKIDDTTYFEITTQLDEQGKWHRHVRMGQKNKLEDVKVTAIHSTKERFGTLIYLKYPEAGSRMDVSCFPGLKTL